MYYQEPHLPNPYTTLHMPVFPQPTPYQPVPIIFAPNQQEPLLSSNSRNYFLSPRTPANGTFNISQTQDFESPACLIFELEHSIKILESMELSTIMMFIESIKKNIGDTITSLQSSLLTSLSKIEKKKINGLPYRIWNVCIELTNEYPEGYDLHLNEFGLFVVILDELLKNSYIADFSTNSTLPIATCGIGSVSSYAQDFQQIKY